MRLVNKKSGKPVTDAVIFAKRIDMAPDAMQEMTAPLEQRVKTYLNGTLTSNIVIDTRQR